MHELVSVPLPILVDCELLGVPLHDRDRFRAWTQANADTSDQARSQKGLTELLDYTQWLVTKKRQEPEDDIISSLCTAENGSIEDSYISLLATVLFFAGNETTVSRIDPAVLFLLANPDQRDFLLADLGRVHDAVEEILRVAVPGSGMTLRYARETFQLGDVVIRAGELVLLSPAAANHDERVFADPTSFDLARKPGQHLAFGYGSGYCIGAPLARIELEEILTRLMTRFPTLRLAVPVEQVGVRQDLLTGGLDKLPVAWER